MGPIGCRETSAQNYQSTLRKIPEESRSLLNFGGSLKSRKIKCSDEGAEDKYVGVPVTRVTTGAERYCSVSIQRIRKLDCADTQRERERERERKRSNVRNTKAEGLYRGQ
jgi:hypothetical protein